MNIGKTHKREKGWMIRYLSSEKHLAYYPNGENGRNDVYKEIKVHPMDIPKCIEGKEFGFYTIKAFTSLNQTSHELAELHEIKGTKVMETMKDYTDQLQETLKEAQEFLKKHGLPEKKPDDLHVQIGLPEGKEWTSEDLAMVEEHAKMYRAEHPIPSTLEQYRDEQAYALKDIQYDDCIGFMKGFDAAIALDLPAQFLKWTLSGDCQYQCTDEDQWTIYMEEDQNYSTDDVYQYWLNNIYTKTE